MATAKVNLNYFNENCRIRNIYLIIHNYAINIYFNSNVQKYEKKIEVLEFTYHVMSTFRTQIFINVQKYAFAHEFGPY